MCGRYYIDISNDILREICAEVQQKAASTPEYEQLSIKFEGDILPSDIAPVQDASGAYVPMQWGFTGFDGKLLINARSETALEKPTFRESMLERRCLVPASGYYEWQKAGSGREKKTKYRFTLPDEPLYLAGCYRREQGSPLYRFVILTRQATSELAVIHDRMPLIIPPAQAKAWLAEDVGAVGATLNAATVSLNAALV
jgi:putative SOS response-associated peptidase YedK